MLDANMLRSNHLLASLPSVDRKRIAPELELVSFDLGAVLYESGVALRHLYFPTTALVSLLYITESGESAELAVAGREGVVGIGLFMGGESTPVGPSCRLLAMRFACRLQFLTASSSATGRCN